MVKGISRQVIVVHSPDPKLFEQAIFILKDNAVGEDHRRGAFEGSPKSYPHRRPDEKEAAPVPLRRGVGGWRRAADRAYLAHYGFVLRLRNDPICDTIPHIAAGGGVPPEGDFPCG